MRKKKIFYAKNNFFLSLKSVWNKGEILTTIVIVRFENLVLNKQFELRVGQVTQIVIRKTFWEKFPDFVVEAAKPFMLYFEVLQDGFV